MEEFLTTEEIAKTLKVHVITVRRWIVAGKLSATSIGKSYRISKKDLEKFLSKGKKEL